MQANAQEAAITKNHITQVLVKWGVGQSQRQSLMSKLSLGQSLVSKLSPLAASKRPAGALSPTDVALFPTSPCTAECCLKEASHTPGALPSGGCPGKPICGLSTRSAAPY